jgi:wyosine [tRNA(Phe)-imidazoG37] synthetase (radical SAM superfamily)
MTACVSSQVGCSLDCKFCATGYLKRERNLTAAEIFDQVWLLNQLALEHYQKNLDNIVYMGMGEPLLNYAEVWRSTEIISSPDGLGMSPQRLTVSTAGISKMIIKMADDGARFNLALSLHAANNEKRSAIMPINDSNPIESLTEALKYWYEKTGSRPTLEYAVIDGVNDEGAEMHELVAFARKVPCKINLIEYLWIKIIVILRDYGVPFEKIKETKELMFTNIFDVLAEEKDDYIKFLRENSKVSEKKIKMVDETLTLARSEMDNSPEEFKVYYTLIGNLILDLLLKNDKGYITLSKQDKEYEVGYFSIKSMLEFEASVQPLFDKPCLFVPIRSIIEEFLEDYKTEKIAETISLLNLKEMKVIGAIRNKDFKEIIIKQDGKKESIIIEIEKDGNLLDQKAKELKRILGLNEYSEVTIKFRNDKNLYFKNKTRL